MKKNDDCFMRITNNDIYDIILEVRQEVKTLREEIGTLKSKAKLNTWISTTALTLVIGLIMGMIIK